MSGLRDHPVIENLAAPVVELDQEYYDAACRRIEEAKERIIEHGS